MCKSCLVGNAINAFDFLNDLKEQPELSELLEKYGLTFEDYLQFQKLIAAFAKMGIEEINDNLDEQ